MPPRERAVDRGTRRGMALARELGQELRLARVEHGLSQEAVGRAVGLSDTEVGRIERGLIAKVSIVNLSRLLSVVGLELAGRAYPTGAPLRDKPQLALLARLRQHVAADFMWRTEVRIGQTGDLRAWDAVLSLGLHRVGVEAETRLTDFQAVDRRIALKCRDSGVTDALLLLADTRTNRAAIRNHEMSVRDSFPIPGRQAVQALRDGRLPGGSAIVLL